MDCSVLRLSIRHVSARWISAALVSLGLTAVPVAAGPADCVNPSALGVAREIQIDASTGGMYGSMTARKRNPSLLKAKEVVLTFDDGPMPWITRSILDTLERHCARATFFATGRMALAYPATVRDIVARGHTLGSHTYSHPFRLPRMAREDAIDEIERGFAAVASAAGTGIAPFFRFTGLSDSDALVEVLKSRGAAAFTVDIVSNDSYIHDVATLTKRTLAEVDARGGGIVLFHDIKTTTAKALPAILDGLKARGYRIAHLTARAPFEPLPALTSEYAPRVARLVAKGGADKKILPFYGALGPSKENILGELEVPHGQQARQTPPVKPQLAKKSPPAKRNPPADETAAIGWAERHLSEKAVEARAASGSSQEAGQSWETGSISASPPIFMHEDNAAASWTPVIKESAPAGERARTKTRAAP